MKNVPRTFSIGNVVVPNSLVLAPMAGVTDIIYRALCREMGAGLVFTEMVSDQGLVHRNKQSHAITQISAEERPVAVQLFGHDPDIMARAAELLCNKRPDLLDINMGCPVPKVVRNGEGAALMKEPLLAERIIRTVRSAVSIPVTVKIRKGWDDTSANAVEFAKRCEEAGASAVTVHGRTRTQFYSGKADWDIIAEVKRSLSVPVIGNGDVWEPDDAIRMLSYTACDAVMIARGSLGNPWIFSRTLQLMAGSETPPPSARDRICMALRHLGMCVERQGEKSAIPYMRKHIGWYIKGLQGSARLRQQVNAARTREQVTHLLLEYVSRLEEGEV